MTPAVMRSWRGLREGSAAVWPTRTALAGLRPADRIVLLGLAAWTATAILLSAVALLWPSGLPAPERPPTALAGAAPLEAGVAFEQRPLFARTRRPAPVVAPPVMAAPALDRSLTLTGVFIDGSHARALMTSGGDLTGRWLSPNDMIGGWTIASLSSDAVSLTGGGETLTVGLHAAAQTAGAIGPTLGGVPLPEDLRHATNAPTLPLRNPDPPRIDPTMLFKMLHPTGMPAP